MSSTFPAIPGYTGPWSLRDFLQRHFFLRLRFEASPAPRGDDGGRVISLRPTGGFAVVVYASLAAPPPPPVKRLEAIEARETKEKIEAKEKKENRETAETARRPLTSSLLRCAFWPSLFAQLGPAAASFIATWCPVVVQFEPGGGGLQVLGPPLKMRVPRAAKSERSASCFSLAPKKLGRFEGRRKCEEVPAAKRAPLLLPSLYRLNVSRLALVEDETPRNLAETNHKMGLMLAKLWQQQQHNKKNNNGCAETLPATSSSSCVVTAGSVTVPCPDGCHVLATSKELVRLVFPYTFSESSGDNNENASTTHNMESVERHLTHVLHCVLGGVCRMNFRGAAIKHAGFLEQRSLSSCPSHGKTAVPPYTPAPVSELTVPESVILSYLRTLLDRLWWCAAPHGVERTKFWGEASVLEKLCDVTLSWLQCGRHEIFPLSHFLHNVPVAKLPWLRGFYTCKDHGRKRRSMIQQRIFLQLIYFIFQHIVPFMLRRSFHVTWSSKNPNAFLFIPKPVWIRLVKRELQHVCLPRKRGVKRNRDDSNDDDGNEQRGKPFPPMALRRMTSDEIVRSSNLLPENISAMGAAAAGAGGGATQPVLLYSSVRFLVDQRKLRPIARVRFSSARWLLKMADGWSPSSSSSLTTRVLPNVKAGSLTRGMRSSSGSPNATALRGALRCLLAGVSEQRVGSSLVKFTNISNQDEYSEIRSFIENTRQFCRNPQIVSSFASSKAPESGSVTVTMVRGDAARCYDCLPQEAVMNVVERLIPHELYYTLTLTAIVPLPRNRAGHSARGEGNEASEEKGSDIFLHQCVRLRTVSGECVRSGTLLGIPKGWIMYEETTTSSSSSSSSSSGVVLRGAEVRAVLRQHLQRHLVIIDGKLYSQRVGITQGSSVAMLICDILLKTVDKFLSDILSQHEEPSLLLRRVDDVLVVTSSSVAADRCVAALRCGWPEVGFFCQGEKLRCTTVALIPWCGLLWNPQSLEFSVEWRRLAPLLPNITLRPRTSNEPLHSSMRFMSILCLRTPLTVLCRRINSKARVVQTLCEIGFLWSRFFLQKILQNIMFIRPHVRALLNPLALATASLRRLIKRQTAKLEGLGSFCDITDNDSRLCLLYTLHKTLNDRLPWMIAHVRRKRGGGLKRFLLIFSSLVQRKMKETRTIVMMEDNAAPCERDSDRCASVSSEVSHGSNGAVDVYTLLQKGGDDNDTDDTVIARALAAVRFSSPRNSDT